MKQFMLVLSTVLFLFACKNDGVKGDHAEVSNASGSAAVSSTGATTYNVGTGTVNWTGSKPTGKHMGTINVSSGELGVEDGNVTSGSFTLDMNSINVTDLEGDKKTNLEGHLKTGDFFMVSDYPTAKFVITGVSPSSHEGMTHDVTGNLTIKDHTKSITIPANITLAGDKVVVASDNFVINRTEWGINYKSGLIGTVADKIIHDDIALVVSLEANK